MNLEICKPIRVRGDGGKEETFRGTRLQREPIIYKEHTSRTVCYIFRSHILHTHIPRWRRGWRLSWGGGRCTQSPVPQPLWPASAWAWPGSGLCEGCVCCWLSPAPPCCVLLLLKNAHMKHTWKYSEISVDHYQRHFETKELPVM